MPYTSTGVGNIDYVYQEYTINGSAKVQYRTLNYDNVVQTLWNDTDRRVKPDPLIENMTSSPEQYTLKKNAGSTGFYPYLPEVGTRSVVKRQEMRYWGAHIAPETSPDTSDWINPLRIKIKNEATNLGTMLAEYRQSVNMFGSAARGIVDAWRSFRKLKIRENKKPLSMCSVASAELIYAYGVAPLVSDLFDSMERLRDRLGHPVFRRYHTKSRDIAFTKWEKKYPISGSYGTGGFTGWSSWKQSKYITAYVWFDLEKASEFIFGNPLELAWEVTPYSFVVDWMLPIGDYLIALDALKAVDHMKVSITQKDVRKHRIFLWGLSDSTYPGGKAAHRGSGAKPMTYHKRSHKRDIDTTLPLPTLPKFEISGSIKRLLNAQALLVNARGCDGVAPRYHRNDFTSGMRDWY